MKRWVLRAAFAAAFLAVSLPAVRAQDALRPEVGKPLAKAKALLAAKRYPEAMAQVRLADGARGKSAQESFVIAEMRGAIAQGSGDVATAAKTYQDLLASGRVPPAEQQKLLAAEAGFSYKLGDFPAALEWLNRYYKAGGNAPEMKTFQISAAYAAKDYATAGKLQAAQIAAGLKAGQKPTEQQLQLLANSQQNTGDKAGFNYTMVQLVYYYPKPDYWQNLIHNVQTKPGYSDRFTLDIDRFEAAVGLLKKPGEVMEMAQLALQVPLPGEAKTIVDRGYTESVLGQGPEAPRHKRLRDLVERTYAEQHKTLGTLEAEAVSDREGNKLLLLGEIYVSYGDVAKGIPMMEAGIKKGSLRRPEDAKLHLGLAYLKAGQKARAVATLKTVGGRDGAAEIARLWILQIGRV